VIHPHLETARTSAAFCTSAQRARKASVSGDLISVEIGRDGRRDFVHPFSSAENYLNRLVLA